MSRITPIARRYIGTPFDHQGRVPGPAGGLDCVGLLVCSIREAGGSVEDCTAYGRDSDPVVLLDYVRRFCDPVDPRQKQPDDILVFWEVDSTKPQHVALFTGTTIIHAFDRRAQRGKVREEPLLETRMQKIHSCWRFRWQPSS